MLKKALCLWVLAWAAAVPAAPSLEQQRALFLQAEQALAQNRPAEVRQSLDALADYPLHAYLWAKLLGGTPGLEGEIPAFLERYGQTREAGPLRRLWLDALARREAWDEYVRYYRDGGEVQTQCDHAWALYRLDRVREAWTEAARLWESGEPRPAACDRLFAAWQATPEFTPERLWQRLGLALDKNRDLANALRTLVPGPQRPLADFWFAVHDDPGLIGQCAPWRREVPVSGRIFAHGVDRLAAQDPLRAHSLWQLRRGEFVIPKEEQVRIERRLALALATQRYPQAAAYLAAVADEVADAQVRAWRVRTALWRQDWPSVLAALDRLDAQEQQQAAWRYWRARALEALGQTAAAAELYDRVADEREFYGFAAADHRQRRYPIAFVSPPVDAAELQRLADSEPFRAVREFRALDRIGEAQKEWLHAVQTLPERDLALAARLAQRWGWDRLAILTLAKAKNRDDLSLRFPLAYAEPVSNQARERGLDPALVYGLIRRESAFDASAKSSAGALGLMQIMPTTGEQVARELKEAWSSERILLEPQVNLRYGTAYFRGLLDRFDRHIPLAAAAYNAGPNRVERWLPAAKPLPADIWIETIPYNETRQYVGAVLAYTAIYRERLGGAATRLSEFLADIAPGAKVEGKPDRPAPVPFCP